MASEEEEVAALDRVLTRTVLTKDEDLQQLLIKLLPALIQKLSTTQPKVRAKVLELLNHINKRVKALPGTQLPLLPLVHLALDAAAGPMVRSFALVYVEMAQPRAPPPQQLEAVPLLLTGLASRPTQHKAVVLRVVTSSLALLQQAPAGTYSQVIAKTAPSSSSSSAGAPIIAVSLLPPDAADRQLLLDHALKVLLYQRPSSGNRAAVTPLGLATAAAAGGAAAPAAAAPPPAGLSTADVAALEEKGIPSQEVLTQQKLGLLCLLGAAAAGMPGNAAAAAAGGLQVVGTSSTAQSKAESAGEMETDEQQPQQSGPDAAVRSVKSGSYLSSEELLLPLLAASCDPYEAVARRGSDLLVKLINPDAARPAVDLESQQLVTALMKLMLGDQDPSTAAPAPSPAGPALAVRIMQLLVRSVTAARTFPSAPLVMSACLFGPSSSPRLVKLGAEWAGWVFKHAEIHQLKAMAGPVAARLLAAVGLDEGDDEQQQQQGGPQQAAQDDMQVDGAAPITTINIKSSTSSGSSVSVSVEVRGHVFSALAQLTQRLPDMFKSDTVLAGRLFSALSSEPPGSRAALQEALGGLAAAMTTGVKGTNTAAGGGVIDDSKRAEIEQLLMSHITSDQASVRLCAAQWATRLFPTTHMPSRYICLLAAGDVKPEVREVGLSGLGLSRTQIPPAPAPSVYKAAVLKLGLPQPGDVIRYLVSKHKQLSQPGDLSRPLPLPDASCHALIDFITAAATAAAAAAAGGSSKSTVAESPYDAAAHAVLLENLACRGSSRDTAAAAVEGLIVLLSGTADWMRGHETSQQQAHELRQRFVTSRMSWLTHWLSHHHLPVRAAAAKLAALAAAAAAPAEAQTQLRQLMDAFPQSGNAAGGSSSSSRLEEQEGSILAAGLLVARAAGQDVPTINADQQQQVVAALIQQLKQHTGTTGSSKSDTAASTGSSSRLMLAGAAAAALGYIGLIGGIDIPGLLSASSAAAAGGSSSEEKALSSASADGSSNSSSVLSLLLDLAKGKDSRAALRAVTALGYIAAGSSSTDVHMAVAKGILGVSSVKGVSEELLLALGDSAAVTAGGVTGFTPDIMLWSNFDSVSDCVDAVVGIHSDRPAEQHMEVDEPKEAAAAGGGGGGDQSAERLSVEEFLLKEICGSMAVSSKEEVRCAGCLLLVCLVQLCQGSQLLSSRLAQLQATFTGLLGDSNELTQDLAARGVSLVYSRGGGALQQQLLSQLLGLLQGGQSSAAAAGAAGVKLSGDTKLFEEGQLGNTPGGGGLTTYRELCSLANDLGQPDLIYRFMDLARASSAVTARRGAAVGVARIARLAAAATGDEQAGLSSLLGPDRLAALLPKLYRLTHDPSPKVSESMSSIWAALLSDPRAALDTHFNAIVKSLLSDVGARLWRVRQAACAALTDILSGRRWDQLQQHMEQLWLMCLRGVDDVKESVRAAAGALLRALRGISLRLMDLQQTKAADVAGCCRAVLPLLSGSSGLGSSVDVVRGVSADVICEGIKTAGAAQVLPVLPTVVPVLLEALSGLEDARLNYVEQHAAAVGIDAERLTAARLAAARASTLTEALDAAARAVTPAAAAEMAPGLAALIRRGVGLSTKVGAARFIKALSTRLGQELKPAAPALLKPLIAAVSAESSMQVKRAYAGAAAALAVRCVGDKRRDKFVADAVAAYGAVSVSIEPYSPGSSSTPGTDSMNVDEATSVEDGSRQAGGLLLRELLRESSDTFQTYASQILPTAFLASHDEVSSVSSVWGGVWSEGCPSEPAALRMFTPELAGLVAGGVMSSSWDRKKGAAKALLVIADVAGDQLASYSPALSGLLLSEGCGGRLWEGKELLLQALGALAAHCTATLVQQPGAAVLLKGLLSASSRKKTTYRSAALAALQQLLDALGGASGSSSPLSTVDGKEVWGTVSPALIEALQQQLAAVTKQPQQAPSQDKRSAGSTAAAGGALEQQPGDEVKPLPLIETCSCLSSAYKLLPATDQSEALSAFVPPITGLMSAPGMSWTSWLAVVAVAAAVLEVAEKSPSDEPKGCLEKCLPFVTGIVHIIQHSNISQLRKKCLETLQQYIKLLSKRESRMGALKKASSSQDAANDSRPDWLTGLKACLTSVRNQDPSVAHQALATQMKDLLRAMEAADD